MNIFRIFLLAFIGAAASITIKRTNPEISMMIGIVTGFLIIFFSANEIMIVFGGIKDFFSKININGAYINLMLKIIGITYLGEFASSALKDAGESGIASKVEIFSKLLIVAMAMPAFASFIGNAFEILS